MITHKPNLIEIVVTTGQLSSEEIAQLQKELTTLSHHYDFIFTKATDLGCYARWKNPLNEKDDPGFLNAAAGFVDSNIRQIIKSFQT